ncbi:MAG: hypothetical protein EXX96DRAFT_538359 [Benjaminiella poitrasii]|nr:MAG: hypothetical protein EXX96DRAFT_538359 [Benjaminiella poitrasii]
MTKEMKQFITQQKKVYIKINKAALGDINKKALDKSTSNKRKTIAVNNPAVLFIKQYQEDNEGKKANITKNYIIDTTDTSNIDIIKAFEEKYLFKPQSVKLHSEQDFIVNFWSYVFEEVFSNSGLYLHWGEYEALAS